MRWLSYYVRFTVQVVRQLRHGSHPAITDCGLCCLMVPGLECGSPKCYEWLGSSTAEVSAKTKVSRKLRPVAGREVRRISHRGRERRAKGIRPNLRTRQTPPSTRPRSSDLLCRVRIFVTPANINNNFPKFIASQGRALCASSTRNLSPE